jgi:asparagine synthase (glutamine-hydrolysing)
LSPGRPRDDFSGCFPAAPAGTDEAVDVQVHGAIFNGPELCAALGLPPTTPPETWLACGWRRWSADLLPRLDGVFALALRDRGELLLYRDPYGPSSLYWHRRADGGIVYATHLDRLFEQPGVPRQIARRSLHEYLRFLDIAAPHTLFEGVQSLEAGHLLRCNARGLAVAAVPAPAASGPAEPSFDDAVDRLDALLQRGVALRLAGAERPAAFLSGGVDSSLLCAIAARQRADTTAITVGFDTAPYDEAPVARQVATHVGLAHEVWRFGRPEYLAALDRLSRRAEQPAADPATPATVLAFERCRSRFDTVLDGTGADDAIGVMPPRHVRVAVGFGSRVPRSLRVVLVRGLRAVPGLSGYTPLLDFEHPADTMIRWGGFTRPEIERLCGEPVSFADTTFYRTFERHRRDTHFGRYTALYNAMPFERLTQATRVSGLAVNYPFYERDTDRFLRQLPADFRHLPEQPKRILRALLARYVPRELWDLPKHGFDFPLAAFLEGDDFALVRGHLDEDRWRDGAVLRGDLVARCARDFIAGDRRLVFRVWALVVLGAWLQAHGLQP